MIGQRFFETAYNLASRLPKGSLWWRIARAIFLFGTKLIRKDRITTTSVRADLSTIMTFLHGDPNRTPLFDIGPVEIILPIYNGYKQCMRLWESLRPTLRSDDHLIIIDDASTDDRIQTFLNDVQGQAFHVSVIHHAENRGFVRSVNEAAKRTVHHFIILNSDVEVPAGWIERLMEPMITGKKVASVTPMTNAGEICSFPEFLRDNPLPPNVKTVALDQLFRHVDPTKIMCSIPTGVGFCMGFNKHVVDLVGLFDEEAFGRGYGEENDWSMRALARGYHHLLVPNLFVFHEHGASFPAEERGPLCEKNFRFVSKRHPTYPILLRNYIALDPLVKLRELLQVIVGARFQSTKRILIIDHELGGGSHDYREQVIRRRLGDNEMVLLLTYSLELKKYLLKIYHQAAAAEYVMEKFEWPFSGLLHFVSLDEVLINGLVSFPAPVELLKQIQILHTHHQIPITLCLHDYFPLCPSYNLLNDRGVYCSVPSMKECERCLPANRNEFRVYYPSVPSVMNWREEWKEFFQVLSAIECYSTTAENIFRKAYPDIPTSKFYLRPHQRNELRKVAKKAAHQNQLVIGILGRITEAKGLDIVKKMLKVIETRRLDTVRCIIVGSTVERLHHPSLRVTGPYNREELPSLIEKHQIDVIFIPSLWPETFSFTTEEALLMGVPVAVFDIGAPSERVRASGRGIIIEKIDAEYALDKILAFGQSHQGFIDDEK